MTGNAYATAVQPALERRWADALASFRRADRGRRARGAGADTVEEVSELLERYGVAPVSWYGTWLFVDWLELAGTQLDPSGTEQVAATAAVELEASRRDPCRQLSRAFHLVGQRRQE